MAVRLLNGEVSDLCLGKPEVICIAANATISDALTTLKASGDTHVSVWLCNGESVDDCSCRCVGKFSVADVILFLCREENLADPFKALESPVSDVLPKGFPIVRRLEPNSSLWEAIDYIIEGTQNLLIPLQNNPSRKKFLNKHHRGQVYCWLTQEDVVRYLFNSIGVFSPIPAHTIDFLNIIDHDIMTVPYNNPASSALPFFRRSLNEQKPVAVVDEENRVIGEISPFTLSCCDETAAAAIMALSAMDLMAHIDCHGPSMDLIHLVKMKLGAKNLEGMVELVDELCVTLGLSSSCSSDDESISSQNSWSCRSRLANARRSEAIVCGLGSSLVAVMVQALVNRVSSIWVMEEDQGLVGTVTFAGILEAFRNAALGKIL